MATRRLIQGDQIPLDLEGCFPLVDERPFSRSEAWKQRRRRYFCNLGRDMISKFPLTEFSEAVDQLLKSPALDAAAKAPDPQLSKAAQEVQASGRALLEKTAQQSATALSHL